MNRRLALLTVGLFVVVGLSFPSHALADDKDNTGWKKTEQDFVLDTNVINGCNGGESVHLVGTGHISVRTKLHQGAIETKETDNFSASGTGAVSGASYSFAEVGSINEYFGANPDGTPFSYVESRTQTLDGNGVPDQIITYYIKLVIDGNGNVLTDIFDFNLVCQ